MAPFPAQSWTLFMEREIFWYGVLFLIKIPKCHDTWVDVGRRIWLGDIWQWVPALNAATRSIWSPTAHDWGEYLYYSCSCSGSGSGSCTCSCYFCLCFFLNLQATSISARTNNCRGATSCTGPMSDELPGKAKLQLPAPPPLPNLVTTHTP